MEELENNYNHMRSHTLQYFNDKKVEWNTHLDNFIEELKEDVNNRVNRFSQISSMIIVPTPFEKTPTQKIKRYLYKI